MEKKKEIIIVPQGGIANRLRALMSAYTLAINLNRPLKILWVRDNELNASFSDIFQQKCEFYQIEEISQLKFLLRYSPPRKKNVFISYLIQSLYDYYYFNQIGKRSIFPSKEQWLSGFNDKSFIIVSGSSFFDYDPALINTVFPISNIVRNRVSEILKRKMPQFAIHIRRTDNELSIKYSPIDLFVETIDYELSKNREALFFLATDDESVKKTLIKKYPNNIIFNLVPANRKTSKGIIDGMSELEIISQCDIIYGSYWSSFTEIAAQKGNKKLIVLKTSIPS